MKKAKLKTKVLNFAVKKFKTFFFSEVLLSNPSPRLENFQWPVMVVKLGKVQTLKILETIAKISDNANVKTIPWPIKVFQLLIIKTLRRFSSPWGWKHFSNDNKCQKNKIAKFVKKC